MVARSFLEMELFKSRICSVRFFELAQQASAEPDRDALEVFVNCVQLGFAVHGQSVSPRSQYQLERLCFCPHYPAMAEAVGSTLDRRLRHARL